MVAQENAVSSSRVLVIGIIHPISVWIGMQFEIKPFCKQEAIIDGGFEILEYVFDSCSVRYFGIIHKLTDLIDRE